MNNIPKTSPDSNAKKQKEAKWIDISIPFRNAMVHWPTDPIPQIQRIMDVDRGDKVTLTDLHFISHTGTHVDAPLHFIPHGGTIDQMPLDTTIGLARVIEIKDSESIKTEELVPYNIQKGERILFKTLNSTTLYKTDEFFKRYIFITPEAAQYLVDRGIRMVGLDYISIYKYETEKEYPSTVEYLARSGMHRTHRSFLGQGIYIIEGLNLSEVAAGFYELVCLPIKLEQGDAGVARAILKSV